MGKRNKLYTSFTKIGLKSAIEASYSPSPKVHFTNAIFDVKEWLGSHLNDIHGHTQPLSFKFTLNEEGRAVMHYKQWRSDPWSEEGLILLKVWSSIAMYVGSS